MANMVRKTADTTYATLHGSNNNKRKAAVEWFSQDRQFCDCRFDIAAIEQHRHEPGRPLRKYLGSRQA